MKKLVLVPAVIALISSSAYAKDNFAKSIEKIVPEKKAAEKAAPAPVASSLSPAAQAKHEELKKLLDEKKKELNGSEWKVDVSSAGKSLGEDVMTFQNQQITCKTLKDKGYPATNYTVSLPEGSDMAVWETMQTNPKGGVVFIRGEWKEGVMRGVMSEQLGEGKSQDLNFASVAKTAVPETTEEKKEEKKEELVPAADSTMKASEEAAAPVVQAFEASANSDQAVSTVVEAAAEVVTEEVAPFNPGTTDEKR